MQAAPKEKGSPGRNTGRKKTMDITELEDVYSENDKYCLLYTSCGQGKRGQNGRRATGHGAKSEQGKREQNGRRAAEYGAESGQAAGETGEAGGNVWG